jgi:uncharacterized protein YciI
MKHFVVEIIYTVPIEKIEELTPIHREFLQTGYLNGILLISGPKVPRTGGIVIARGNSLEEVSDFFKNDPYSLNNAAKYHLTEFNAKSHQPFLKEWLE